MKGRHFLACIFLFLLAAFLIYLDNTLVKLTHYTVRSSEIPQEFDGFKIIQLSDIHGAEFGNGNSRLINKVKRARPDIILITGDIVNNTDDNAIEVFESIMTGLDGVAPMYAVTGNHDEMDSEFYSYIDKWENEHNIRWLDNETVTLTRDGRSIYLSGIADPNIWNGAVCDEKIKEITASMDAPDGYNILMFHRADMLDLFIDSQYDIAFSGHLHGGQWRIPFVGGLISPNMDFFPEYSGGRYERGGKTFIVSCGIGNKQTFPGTEIMVPRVFNMAEIVEVTLEAK